MTTEKNELKNYLFIIIILSAILLFFIVGGVVLYFSEPGKSWWLPGCHFYELTGLYCSGCGGTRAVYALLHGNIAGFLRNNLMLLPALILIILLLVKPELSTNKTFCFTILALIVLYGILRNIPVYPFTLLAPLSA